MGASAPRQFSHLDEEAPSSSTQSPTDDVVFQTLLTTVRDGIIGANESFISPYGPRKIVYADYVASGRALGFIEEYIQKEVLPVYGNTHTTSSATGVQTTLFRSEARDVIHRSVNASKDDVVLFCGSGATAAIATLVNILGVGPRHLVITGPYEHHSNMLPWKESGATVITVNEDRSGTGSGIDLAHLDQLLSDNTDYDMRIGAFSAASNITGIISDTDAINVILHRHGAISLYDMACAAPYLPVDMNPGHDVRLQKDAVVLSSHKLIGGVSSPGILIVKARLLTNPVPNRPGGGTVFFVKSDRHRYLSNFVEREEGGTPDIIGSIRAALAFDLRNALNIDRIKNREIEICDYVKGRLINHPSLVVLGDLTAPRLPIFSFMIRSPNAPHFLHHNFVSALLNDLFGVNCRGGCACAGPYAQQLMGIDSDAADRFEHELLNKIEVLRPGFVRINFPYFETQKAIDYVVDAVLFVSDHGWKFLPDYGYLIDTGEWRHRSVMTKAKDRRWLSHISYQTGQFQYKSQSRVAPSRELVEYVAEAHTLMATAVSSYPRHLPDTVQALPASAQSLRWFMVPHEALQMLNGSSLDQNTPAIAIAPERYFTNRPAPSDSESQPLPVNIQSLSPAPQSCTTCPLSPPRPQCANCYHPHSPTSHHCLSCECVDYRLMAPVDNKLSRHLLNKLVQLATRAIAEFNMFDAHSPDQPPTRLLVAVSGGKDSLALVDILMEIRRRVPYKFDIGACTVDPMTPEYDPSPLKKYFEHLGIPYYYQQQPIIESAKTCMRSGSGARQSICSFCSRMKRGILYSTARAHGYNALCMGQHLDDLAESFVMSAFHNGACTTMKANYHVAEGDIRVIRPLVLVRERLTREYAKVANLPVIFENCPACFESPKERQRIKVMLANQEHIHPNLFSSLLRCMKPLMSRENRAYHVNDAA